MENKIKKYFAIIMVFNNGKPMITAVEVEKMPKDISEINSNYVLTSGKHIPSRWELGNNTPTLSISWVEVDGDGEERTRALFGEIVKISKEYKVPFFKKIYNLDI